MAMMSDSKRLKNFELEQVKTQQEIKKRRTALAEAKSLYKESVAAGKSASATLEVMDELLFEIDNL